MHASYESKVLFGVLLFVLNFAAACIPIYFFRWFSRARVISMLSSAAGGLLLGFALLEFLTEAEKRPLGKGFPVSHFLCGVGFVATMAAQKVTSVWKQYTHTRGHTHVEMTEGGGGEDT